MKNSNDALHSTTFPERDSELPSCAVLRPFGATHRKEAQ